MTLPSFNNRAAGIVTTLAFVCLCIAIVSPAQAQRRSGDLGLGGQIGEPSGITLKIYNPSSVSYDFLAAWDLDDFFFLNVHGTYERRVGNNPNVRFFFGPGGFIGFRDRGRDRDDDVVAGISGTFGISFWVEQFEIYARLTPRLSVVPDTDGDLGGGLGLRFYF